MGFATRSVLLSLFLAAPLAADAKGIFQAQGQVSEVRRDGDTIIFRFRGWISAGYASAPDDDRRRRWHDMRWDAVDVPVTLREWTRRNAPNERDPAPALDALQSQIEDAAQQGKRVGFSIDNPAFFLTNRGQLARVAGSYVYIGPAEPTSSRAGRN
jgi:hypothetical protein